MDVLESQVYQQITTMRNYAMHFLLADNTLQVTLKQSFYSQHRNDDEIKRGKVVKWAKHLEELEVLPPPGKCNSY